MIFQVLTEGSSFCARTLVSEAELKRRVLAEIEFCNKKITKKFDHLREKILNETANENYKTHEELIKAKETQKAKLLEIKSNEMNEQYEYVYRSQLSIVILR